MILLSLTWGPWFVWLKDAAWGVPIMARWKWIGLVSMRMRVQSLASLSALRIWHCCELWCSLAATAPIWPLGWEVPYALKRKKKKKKDAAPGLTKMLTNVQYVHCVAFLFFFEKNFIVMIYSVLSISAAQPSDPAIHPYTFFFFTLSSIMLYHNWSDLVSCAIQQNLIAYSSNPKLPVPPTPFPSLLATISVFSVSMSLFFFFP